QHRRFAVDKRSGRLAGSRTPPRYVETRVFTALPPEYSTWAEKNGFVRPPLDASPRETSIKIVQPVQGTRLLIDLRRAHLWPLLGQATAHSGTVLAAQDGALAVDWQLGAARLSLRANLSQSPETLPEAQGRRIQATGAAPGAPLSAFHYLDAAPG
ncbi:hypothetical protein LCGC14_2844610, partial [marine sediment metagenome]